MSVVSTVLLVLSAALTAMPAGPGSVGSSEVHHAMLSSDIGEIAAIPAQGTRARHWRGLVQPAGGLRVGVPHFNPPAGLSTPRCRQWCRQRGNTCKGNINQKALEAKRQHPNLYQDIREFQNAIKRTCANETAQCVANCG